MFTFIISIFVVLIIIIMLGVISHMSQMVKKEKSFQTKKNTKVFEERTFSLKGEQVEMNARWRFIEFPKPITIHQGNAFNVEFLSIDFIFGGQPERCWYWFHEGQLEILQWLYNCAKQNTPESEVLSWMSGLDNYPTTKSERREALKMMTEFNNAIIQTAEDINVLPMWGTE